jgi:hypothetical protein
MVQDLMNDRSRDSEQSSKEIGCGLRSFLAVFCWRSLSLVADDKGAGGCFSDVVGDGFELVVLHTRVIGFDEFFLGYAVLVGFAFKLDINTSLELGPSTPKPVQTGAPSRATVLYPTVVAHHKPAARDVALTPGRSRIPPGTRRFLAGASCQYPGKVSGREPGRRRGLSQRNHRVPLPKH